MYPADELAEQAGARLLVIILLSFVLGIVATKGCDYVRHSYTVTVEKRS